MSLKLYSYPGNKNVYKALIAAQYVGVKVDTPKFEMGVDNKTPEFLAKNPMGKVPVLETPQGAIFESNAIARHVARQADKGLFGATPIDAAHVDQWIDFVTGEIDGPLLSWVLGLMGVWPYDKKKEEGAKEALKRSLTALDQYLELHTYLVGEAVTLADIIATCNLFLGYTKVFDETFRSQYPNVTRYFLTIVNQPQVKTVLGDVALCKEPIKPAAPAKAEKPAAAPKGEKPAVVPKAEKADKPAAESKPAPAPKAEKPAKAKDEEEDDKPPGADEEKAAKQKVDAWLASLAPTSMQLDGWKRLYSNSPAATFREYCINGLWNGAKVPNSLNEEVFPGFDASGYSIWFCNYKYNDENTVNFIVMNKVGGFLQRIDYARKYAFGVMCILKDGPHFPIRGAWIFRGPDLPPQMLDECYDMDLYDWVKVDINDAAQKKRFEDILCEEATIDGLENVEVKVFK